MPLRYAGGMKLILKWLLSAAALLAVAYIYSSGVSVASFGAAMVAALVIGLLVRLHGILVLKKSLSHDESVSYLCAAATEGKFELGLPEQVMHLVRVRHCLLESLMLCLGHWANEVPY